MNIDPLAAAGYGVLAILGFNDWSLGLVFALVACPLYVAGCAIFDRWEEEWW